MHNALTLVSFPASSAANKPTINESAKVPLRKPAAETDCLDAAECHSEREAARLALDEYFKDADWNLVYPGDEEDAADVLDAAQIDESSQEDNGVPQQAAQHQDCEHTQIRTYKVLLEQMTPVYTLLTVTAADTDGAVEVALDELRTSGMTAFRRMAFGL